MINKIILIGRISTDLELKMTSSNKSVINFNLAVNRINDETDFIPVQLWGIQATNLVQYQHKGSLIAIEGRIRVDNYQDNEGNNRNKTYILANNVQFLEKKNSEDIKVGDSNLSDSIDLSDININDDLPFESGDSIDWGNN